MTADEAKSLEFYETACALLHKWAFGPNIRSDVEAAAERVGASYDELRSVIKHLRSRYLAVYESRVAKGKFQGDLFAFYSSMRKPRGRPSVARVARARVSAGMPSPLPGTPYASRHIPTGAGEILGPRARRPPVAYYEDQIRAEMAAIKRPRYEGPQHGHGPFRSASDMTGLGGGFGQVENHRWPAMDYSGYNGFNYGRDAVASGFGYTQGRQLGHGPSHMERGMSAQGILSHGASWPAQQRAQAGMWGENHPVSAYSRSSAFEGPSHSSLLSRAQSAPGDLPAFSSCYPSGGAASSKPPAQAAPMPARAISPVTDADAQLLLRMRKLMASERRPPVLEPSSSASSETSFAYSIPSAASSSSLSNMPSNSNCATPRENFLVGRGTNNIIISSTSSPSNESALLKLAALLSTPKDCHPTSFEAPTTRPPIGTERAAADILSRIIGMAR